MLQLGLAGKLRKQIAEIADDVVLGHVFIALDLLQLGHALLARCEVGDEDLEEVGLGNAGRHAGKARVPGADALGQGVQFLLGSLTGFCHDVPLGVVDAG